MQTSEQIDELAMALAKAQGEMGGAVKDSVNPFFSNAQRRATYADLASVWEACRGPLTKYGLSVVQFPQTEYAGTPEPYDWVAKSGEKRYGVRVVCVVSVLTRLVHSSGQWMEDKVSTMLSTGDPQSVGSAITYLRRYALQSVAGVAAEDDDAESAHGQKANGNGQAKQPAPSTVGPPPKGYADWLDDTRAAAEGGEANLRKAWKDSEKESRDYLMATTPKVWDAIKARAAEVDKAKAPAHA